MPDTPNPDLMPLIGARFLETSEPDDGQRLQEGLIKELTGGETILETRVFDSPEDPNFARDLAGKLTQSYRAFGRQRMPNGDPISLLKPTRALSDAEAQQWAHDILTASLRNAQFTVEPHLLAEVDRLWRRLPRAADPKVSLSYQRMIHHLTMLTAWVNWPEGRDLMQGAEDAAATERARAAEELALEPWRQPAEKT